MSGSSRLVSTLILVCLIATPLHAYVTRKALSSTKSIVQVKWQNGPISWRMNRTFGSNIKGSHDPAEVVRKSFTAWSSIPTAAITLSEDSPTDDGAAYDGKNMILTNLIPDQWLRLGLGSDVLAVTLSNWADTSGGMDRNGQPIAFPGQLMDADIVFNPRYVFSTSDTVPVDQFDFQSTLAHEIGHLLGLDHSPLVSSTMFWVADIGIGSFKPLTADDIAGVSTIYPSASFYSKGTVSGVVRTTTNVPVYGAVVVALNTNGEPAGSAITDPSGQYSIMGLDPGAYTLYAQPLEVFTTSSNYNTLLQIYPDQKVNTDFTARFR